MRSLRRAFLLAGLASSVMTVGCGHSDAEMAAKQREIDKLAAEVRASKSLHEDDAKKLADASEDIEKLRNSLDQAGLVGQKSKEELEKLSKALAEYKQKADQLEKMEQRYRDLRSRLDKLQQVGVKFVVRNNRMVIQLPGDILFDSGKDELKDVGKDVLAQVASVIRNDKDLFGRTFQVAGHTDNAKYPHGGLFKDNWGLSLARARQVLLYLVGPMENPKNKSKEPAGGGLDPKKWAAAGYGEMDPQAGTIEKQSTEEQARNRRVELVLQPNVDEMLNLGNIK